MKLTIESKPYSVTEYYKGTYNGLEFSLMVDEDEGDYDVTFMDDYPEDFQKAEEEIINHYRNK